MKLLFCVACGDVLALRGEERTCECGRSAGTYVDRLHAEISGPSLVLAFLNRDFLKVLAEQLSLGDLDEKLTSPPYAGHTKGRGFTAIVVPESAPTVRRLDEGPYSQSSRGEAATGPKYQSLDSLREEVKAVARGERLAPTDAAEPSVNLRDVLIVGELSDDVVAAIKGAEHGKVLDHLERDLTAHPEKVRRNDVDLDAPSWSDEDPEIKG